MQQRILPPSLSDRQGFNRRWFAPSSDLVVHRPTSTNEVVQAFQEALERDLEPEQVQLTCGRHCYEGFVYNPRTKAIIDLTGLRSHGFDHERGIVHVDVGLGNWDMYRLLNNLYQVTLPAGSCYSVGLGGHITGGGYGLLSRLYGLALDYLHAVDIVVQGEDGRAQHIYCAADNEYQDLLWGVKGGGGGQFGAITRYYFKDLPPSPEEIYSYSISWDWLQNGQPMSYATFQAIVRFFEEEYTRQDEASWNTWANMLLNHVDAGHISIGVFTYYVPSKHGDIEQFRAEQRERCARARKKAAKIADLSRAGHTMHGHPFVADSSSMNASRGSSVQCRQYTYLDGTQTFNSSGPNRFGKYKSAYLTQPWTEHMLYEAYTHLQIPVYDRRGSKHRRLDMSASLIQVDSYGGKINCVPADATAIPQRSSIMKLQYQTYWDNAKPPGKDDRGQARAHIRWINAMYRSIYRKSGGFPNPNRCPEGGVDGCYFNYPDLDLGSDSPRTPPLEFALELYFGGNLPRLRQMKARYNPKGWFGNQQTIRVKPPRALASQDDAAAKSG